jgi:peptidoglycan/LPS O-acetylase OafA/YrhL
MKRIPELDGLRALAALSVMYFHAPLITGTKADMLVGLMWIAVDLFFFLSGYLITSILLKGTFSRTFLVSFYARRTLRIWPLYFFVIFACVALGLIMPSVIPPMTLPQFCGYATFTQELPLWMSPWIDHKALGPFWSLAVEEQFYLVWPFIVLLGGKRAVIPAAIVLLVIGFICRDMMADTRLIAVGRLDGLAYGAILAAILDRGWSTQARRTLAKIFAAVAVVALLAAITWIKFGSQSFWLSQNALVVFAPSFFGLVGFVIVAPGHWVTTPLRAKPVVYLGMISYGLYAYHSIVMITVDRLAGVTAEDTREWNMRDAILLAIKFAATVAVASVSWRFLEQPILSLKDRFKYSRRPALVGVEKATAT